MANEPTPPASTVNADAAVETDLAEAVRTDLLKALYAQATPALLIDLIALTGIVLLFISVGAPSALLLPWAVSISMTALARYMLATRFGERLNGGKERRAWHLAYIATAVPYGVFWGAAGILFVWPGSDASLVVVIFLLCGLGAGALVIYAASFATVFLFLIALFAPFTVQMLLIGGHAAHVALIVSLGWAVFVALIGWRSSQQLRERIMHQRRAIDLTHDLTRARDEAERKSAAKSAFVAKMNHELRTPLNAIIGFTDMIRSRTFGPIGHEKYEEYLNTVHHSGHHLYALIEEILDLSKIEAGKLELNETPNANLDELVNDCVDLLRDRAEAGAIQLRVGPLAGLPRFRLDVTRIKQVIINLMTNAVKFTNPGGTVALGAVENPDGSVTIRVTDTGFGMAPEEIDRALVPFEQIERPGEPVKDGLGLGLTITKSLIEAHDGKIEIESTPGSGTTVAVTLPASRREEAQAATVQPATLAANGQAISPAVKPAESPRPEAAPDTGDTAAPAPAAADPVAVAAAR